MALFLETSTVLLRRIKDIRPFTAKRHRVKGKWATTLPKHPPTRLALQHFDATYSAQLGDLWPSVRVALLSERKYGALLNNFCHNPDLEELQAQGCRDFINSGEANRSYLMFSSASFKQGSDLGAEEDSSRVSTVTDEEEEKVESPVRLSPNIKCLVFPRGDVTRFKPARPDKFGLLSYYLMDAASVLPSLALDVQANHTVLDLCAAPGGKALALLQTQSARFLCLNDSSVSQTSRLKRVLHSYAPKELLTDDKLRITSVDGTMWGEIERNSFDRVLVDVPCTTDRHSLMEDDNNMFSRSRVGERRSLPRLQEELLLAGIIAACPGGEVLYSTCTLCPSQNLGVVERAVQLAEENHGIRLQVVSLRPLVRMFRNTFHFAPDLHLGEMVVPHLAANFGPIYMCKIRRLT
ncbi:5-methylcytosine rRNA methyltransferase NSUN4 [Cyprinodon tularosa]|uniref:5-methylcytosine rRNA methyltransferase NSUN4 n=1 Tax=Cyprinodon tularosa TaxID=77115 RepID=UPI0018E215AE|nr:5-methylcytosine rRNA methyltransferase NSUN4 [Cyprinodon tularosa]